MNQIIHKNNSYYYENVNPHATKRFVVKARAD